jgi:hypothetical protein
MQIGGSGAYSAASLPTTCASGFPLLLLPRQYFLILGKLFESDADVAQEVKEDVVRTVSQFLAFQQLIVRNPIAASGPTNAERCRNARQHAEGNVQ